MNASAQSGLPIDHIIERLKQQLAQHSTTILVAPPGAGKTTRVPLALLNESWLGGRKIIMLEPRRLSTRAAAHYMAAQLSEEIGQTVGYRMRGETRVSAKTRIEVVTEGVLTRLLLEDPSLTDIGLIIFDEFHERNLHADVGLALSLYVRSLFESHVRILLMSATLDQRQLAERLQAPVIESEGRAYPVETGYLEHPAGAHLDEACIRAVLRAAAETKGDILVFLPGVREIKRLEQKIKEKVVDFTICTLYGHLSFEEQVRALMPSPSGRRKVILSSPIAETGLTVEGVTAVIDSGLARQSKFSARTGMSRLETVRISKASAEQRRGRAGRVGPGRCYRLWTEAEHVRLPDYADEEIMNADLTPLALDLALWGANPDELPWLTPPPSSNYEQARSLLKQIGALDQTGSITEYGRKLGAASIHPRLAHMILKAMEEGQGTLACVLAAVLSEKDFFIGRSAMNSDLQARVASVIDVRAVHHEEIDPVTLRRVQDETERLWQSFRLERMTNSDAVEAAGVWLAYAYPDRIAARRSDGRYLLSNGRGAIVKPDQWIAQEPYLVVTELDDSGTDAVIHRAVPITLQQLLSKHQDRITNTSVVAWDSGSKSVKTTMQSRFGAITLKETPHKEADAEQVKAVLLRGIREEGLNVLPWTRSSIQLKERITAMRQIDPQWPDLSDDKLLMYLNEWLGPYVESIRSIAELQRIRLWDVLFSALTWEQQRMLDQLAPTHYIVPSGSKIPIDYANPDTPTLSVRLQELFGLRETPTIAGGKLPITVQLLSPAHRPIQITRDLESFWNSTYFEIKKELKGRYPKHYWPDNPLEAVPTKRAKPR